MFLNRLCRSRDLDRVVEAIACHRERQADFDVEDAIARQLSGGIFRRSLDARLWQRLTITAGVEEEYASPPWEVRNGYCVVKGTGERYALDAGGPRTKYEALFDTRAVFDGLRVSYLTLTCGPRLVRLEDALGEYLASDEPGDAEGTAAVLEYLDLCRQRFHPARELNCPPWFGAAVWPCFVESICDGARAYHLSADELMLVCELCEQNIVVFGNQRSRRVFWQQ